MKCSFWVVRFGHVDAKKAHTQDPEEYKGILRETIGHGGPLKIVFRHDGRFLEAKCALPKEELEKTGGRSCNSQNMLNLCNGAVDIHNTITDIQIYGFYIVDVPICQWVYKYTIAASLSPMIVQEDMIEKWDGKMPQIMTGGGGMMMDISKVISNSAAKK